jgi:hypothetical protein
MPALTVTPDEIDTMLGITEEALLAARAAA